MITYLMLEKKDITNVCGRITANYSVREAGRKLYCSYRMVSDICNNKYKKKEFDLRWMQ